ncbi:MAG TPA: FAD-dependent oxidoreductase [Streptosporangiaceae bacterium]|nr:FAD-dependent oxidoreductase [Streptosporangiaceae bacterium]
MTRRAVAVVGAGIVGCLIARELAEASQDAAITVLDRDLAGSGTSRRSAGLSLARGATPRTRRMSAFSHRYYAGLAAADPRLPIYPVGAKVIGPADLTAAGYLADLADPRPAPAPPGITVPGDQRVWELAGCHYADVYVLAQAIAAKLRPRVRFAESAEVTGLTVGQDEVTVHCATGERLVADQVVLAPGPWLAAPAWRDLLSPLGLRVKKIVAMHLERRPLPGDQVIIFEADDAFLLPVRHRGHWLFSYTAAHWDVDPDAVPGLCPGDLAAARDCLGRYSAELADACDTGRVCCDAYSPAREPVVAALAGGRVVFAGGASGSGYRFAPAIAAQAVALLTSTAPARASTAASEGVTDDHQHV